MARKVADLFVDHACRHHSCRCCTCLAPGAFGFACLGAGSSVIFPLAMSAAAQLKDRPAAVNVAALAQISFVVFFLPHLCLALWLNILVSAMLLQFMPLTVLSLFSLRSLSPVPSTTSRISRDGG